jgi:hypothetical protein
MQTIEKANHQAVLNHLLADARGLGWEIVPQGKGFVLTKNGGTLTLKSRAALALFLVEERLCNAGQIR